jgi:hypothetical protein
MIYLSSNDYNTLELISNLCGKDQKNKPLIGIQALQSLKSNQALVLINRMHPFITDINNDKVFVERTEHAEYLDGIQINTTVKDNKYRKFFDSNIPVPFYDKERDVQEYVIGNEDEVRVLYNLQSAFTRETNALLYYPCVHKNYEDDEIREFSAETFDGILMNVYNFPESFKINEKDKCYYSFQELKFINQVQSYLLFIGLKDIQSKEFKLDRYKNDIAKDLKGTSKLYVNDETIEKMLNEEINYYADKFVFKYEDGTYPEFEPFNALIFDEDGNLRLYVKFTDSENKLYKDIKDEYYLRDFDEENELKDDAEVDIIHFEIIKKA